MIQIPGENILHQTLFSYVNRSFKGNLGMVIKLLIVVYIQKILLSLYWHQQILFGYLNVIVGHVLCSAEIYSAYLVFSLCSMLISGLA